MQQAPGNYHHMHIDWPHLRMPHLLHIPHFHLHFNHNDGHGSSKMEARDFYKLGVPRGCVAVCVGGEGEEQQRFVIPVVYINHPLFQKLLKEAEEEYGFEQKGTITIPCHVSDFQYVQCLIDQQQHHHSHSISFCFR
jgi:SAUR family protein